jgi:hypothetical protein
MRYKQYVYPDVLLGVQDNSDVVDCQACCLSWSRGLLGGIRLGPGWCPYLMLTIGWRWREVGNTRQM